MTYSEEAVFPATLDELHNMLRLVTQSGIKLSFPKEMLSKLELACEELLVNIISYAYPSQSGEVRISCQASPDKLCVTITDHGIPFNPLIAATDLQHEVPPSERKLGGLGIFLAKNSVDTFTYQHNGGCNVVTLTVSTGS